MASQFWVGLLVSTVLWFVFDWLVGQVVHDEAAAFVWTSVLAITSGALVMLAWRLRAVRAGTHRKAGWGVKRK